MQDKASILRNGILAGLAGGLAEIAWVSAYGTITGVDPAVVARAVTTAAGVNAILPTSPVVIGIVVHMTLAILLGTLLAWAYGLISERLNAYWLAMPALLAVWGFNFLVLLPAIDPSFVALLPYPVSLASKLLFAFASAETLRRCSHEEFVMRRA